MLGRGLEQNPDGEQGFRVLNENWLDPYGVFMDLCKNGDYPEKNRKFPHDFFENFFFFFTCNRDVTPRAFRNDASNSKLFGTISNGFLSYATKGSVVWVEGLQGRLLKGV